MTHEASISSASGPPSASHIARSLPSRWITHRRKRLWTSWVGITSTRMREKIAHEARAFHVFAQRRLPGAVRRVAVRRRALLAADGVVGPRLLALLQRSGPLLPVLLGQEVLEERGAVRVGTRRRVDLDQLLRGQVAERIEGGGPLEAADRVREVGRRDVQPRELAEV